MKIRHRRCLWIIAAAAFAAVPMSSAPLDDARGVWTISPTITSHYVFRGVELAGASFQPWIDYTLGPLSVGVWSSTSLKDRSPREPDPEIDLYGSYTFTTQSGALGIMPGFYYYTYPDAKRSSGHYSSTFEPSLAAIFSVGGVQFTPKVYYNVMLKGATFEITAAIALPLKSLGTELDLSATAGTYKWNAVRANASPEEKNWGDYWMLGAAVPVQVTTQSKLTIAVGYSDGRNNFYKQGSLPQQTNERAHGQTAVTLSYSISR